jgi:lipopolysaccharide transport system ATP-binding protein
MKPAIRITNVSKLYRLGELQHHWTIGDKLAAVFSRRGPETTRNGQTNGNGRRARNGAGQQDEIWALKDVSFDVAPGEVVGIIGRNGAGKSTLLKILSRITEPTTGEIELHGRVSSLLEVGTGFHPELTGRDNIYLNGSILGMKKAEINRKFDEIVDFSGVERFLETPVKRYSSGMQVRLAFAVAAHLEPDVLVVDEVLAVGDFEFQKKSLGKIHRISREGRTVLYVSHNLQAIRTLCQRAVLLANGERVSDGSVDQVLALYQSGNTQDQSTWSRACTSDDASITFQNLSVSLHGVQPLLMLDCNITTRAQSPCDDALLAINISDASDTAIMQALPSARPFVCGVAGTQDINIRISLPPLIPGIYHLSFWLGPHNTMTYDQVNNALVFRVTASPTLDRTFPHHPDHGCIVPPSVVTSSRPSTAR